MDQRVGRFVRRDRNESPQDDGRVAALAIPASSDPSSSQRGRRRHRDFAAQMDATRSVVRLDAADAARLDTSRALIMPHIDDLARQLDREFGGRPDTALLFAEAADPPQRASAIRRWLTCIIEQPLDPETATYVAAVGHAHVRPQDPAHHIKARYLVTMVSRVQSLLIAVLSSAFRDPAKLGASISAWCKLLTLHLDILLSVYAATESSPRWY